MKNIDVDKLKTTLINHSKHNFPNDLKIEIDQLDNTDELRISFFWNKQNQVEWKGIKVFQFNANEYSKVLETEIKPFALLETHL